MKKLIVCLLGLLLLAGCSSAGYSSISTSEDIYDFNGKKFTTQDLYKILKVSDSTAIVDAIMSKIAEKEEIDQTDLIAYVDEMIEGYRSLGYSELTLQSARTAMMSAGLIESLGKDYIEKNYETLIVEDKPVKMQMAALSDEETANAIISEFNSNLGTFDTICLNHEYNSDVSEKVYLDSDSSLVLDVKEYLNDTDSTGISKVIPYTTTSEDADGNIVENTTYYVLNITSRDVNEFLDEYVESKLDTYSEDDIVSIMFETHDIKFYDQDIYELMSSEYEVLK